MRGITEIERDLAAAEARLQELKNEKLVAEEDAKAPRKGMIRRRYELILTMLEQLEGLGERITDVEGYALHIKGTTFEISSTSGVQEV